MQYVLPVLLAMCQLCGYDVFTSHLKKLNIFSKSWFWPPMFKEIGVGGGDCNVLFWQMWVVILLF